MHCVNFLNDDLNVEYFSQFIKKESADRYFNELKTLPFYTPMFKLRGRNAKQKRQVIAYGDYNTSFSFNGTCIPAEPWSSLMLELRDLVERHSAYVFNYVLVNLYIDGSSYVTPHKDDESGLYTDFPVMVLSFGAERTITFSRPKMPPTHIKLEHGSLYIMMKPTNDLFTHGIARDPSIHSMRISLTFRLIIPTVSPLKKLKMDTSYLNSIPNSGSESVKDSLAESCSHSQEVINCSSSTNHSANSLQDVKSAKTIYAEWDLSQKTFLQIVLRNDFKIRIHICTFMESTNDDMITSKMEVIMTPVTWYFFQRKLLNFKFQSVNDSFISNNELLMASVSEDYCLLQQMFPLNTFGFFLKPALLKLSKDQIFKLTLDHEITESIIEAKFLKLLPDLILKKSPLCSNHLNEDNATENLLTAFAIEAKTCASFLYECLGCVENSSSRLKHGCRLEDTMSKFRSKRQLVYLNMNIHTIVKNLPNTCYCHYNTQFFNCFNILLKEDTILEKMSNL